MLKSRLYELELRKRQAEQQKLEDSKTDIGWGHQIRSYVLDQSRIKDLRTNVEVGNTQAILDGDYLPGARLVETRIAQELGVSQAPVREALRDLEQLGCIVHEPFRGCSVRAFSAAELIEAFPVRAALEALAAQLAAERITEAELLQLAELLATRRAAADRGDAHDPSRAHASFHATIVRAARNLRVLAEREPAGVVR